MNARPILFSAPMVLSLLREAEKPGTGKTQTRRIVKPQPPRGPFQCHYVRSGWAHAAEGGRGGCTDVEIPSPYGAAGDLLWVRETLWVVGEGFDYAADDSLASEITESNEALWGRYGHEDGPDLHPTKIPSIFMPRWASRLTLSIAEIRIERLNGISEADAIAEGRSLTPGDPRGYFPETWDAINGTGAWAENPWVWAISFNVIKKNVDKVMRLAA